ncbi:ATP-utilizing enzyme of the PP-loop superfamily [Liquorilactobacillus sucicola DSM 21376 = JCM 15457]|uniref:PP family ATPase n=1 Tax=Liquorilactobacillus sucicola DSM 21376 = JCM 15457 TaxID=1423806 RepID=A0A023CXT2_9LACO|nr:ATP-dependent sacrificial sulfur transferase LarE [Liquorilactobacillus sucicola]KRN07130.1 PP family ATPase [Liquorilactobacillus sucicola DSM 21376 = JCM 15457]GAJ26629.1 ATP-utilizing enzyme of the PP-loop superfamily [Liquorilactobacillus sucicola DSM 21376 = JCM 15457]
METFMEKEDKLQNILAGYNKVVVGFSGGIDSTLVLKEAADILGKKNVLAIVANSELFTDEEYNKAIALAQELDVQVNGIELDYLADENISNNTPQSWYYMKKMFYSALNKVAADFNADAVLDGMIMDDNTDFRPGLRARDEAKAVSVLQKADIYKTDVRKIAKKLGLNNWNKVASCSVSSRFPYYTKLDSKKIARVMDAEAYLRGLGFSTVRVRVHGTVARVEVPTDSFAGFMSLREKINNKLLKLGYEFVTLDLSGFESGRMNEVLSENTKKKVLVG